MVARTVVPEGTVRSVVRKSFVWIFLVRSVVPIMRFGFVRSNGPMFGYDMAQIIGLVQNIECAYFEKFRLNFEGS